MEGTLEETPVAQRALAETQDVAARLPYFCSGCPHNSSTVVPEGMRAYAGIGCHYMAQWMDRSTLGYTQMGGEGANWIGEAPFSKRPHVFQNLGDGTYNHSGYMAIRAAIAAGTNITYKILFNDAVAMTGGQRNDGTLTVPQIARQVRSFGVDRIAVVSDEPHKYPSRTEFPQGVSFHHRDELQALQSDLMGVRGTSVLIYDQTCAAEKRRRRRKGEFPDPARRVFINEEVRSTEIRGKRVGSRRHRRVDDATCLVQVDAPQQALYRAEREPQQGAEDLPAIEGINGEHVEDEDGEIDELDRVKELPCVRRFRAQTAQSDVVAVIEKMIKQRQESSTIYRANGRPELADIEDGEIAVIQSFLPKQMSEDEVKAAISTAVAETGAASMKDMGKVVAFLKERFSGQMDFGKASGLVKGMLAG